MGKVNTNDYSNFPCQVSSFIIFSQVYSAMMPWFCLRFVIVVFPDHTNYYNGEQHEMQVQHFKHIAHVKFHSIKIDTMSA